MKTNQAAQHSPKYTGKDYRGTMPDDTDFAEVAWAFRVQGFRLVEAANKVVREWDGHHRFLLEIAAWNSLVANEKQITNGGKE